MNSRPTRTTTTARLATAAPAPLSTIQRPQREKRPSNRKAMADDAEPTGPHRRGRKKQVSAKKNAESAEIGHCKGQPENKDSFLQPKAKPPKVVHAVTASKASRTRPPKVAIDSALRNDNSNILNEGDDDDDNDDDGEIGSGVANPFGDGNDEDDDDNDEETNSTAAANASVSQERPQSNKNVGRNGSKAIKKPARSMNSPALTVQPKILILSTSARGPPTSASTASVPQPSIQATKKIPAPTAKRAHEPDSDDARTIRATKTFKRLDGRAGAILHNKLQAFKGGKVKVKVEKDLATPQRIKVKKEPASTVIELSSSTEIDSDIQLISPTAAVAHVNAFLSKPPSPGTIAYTKMHSSSLEYHQLCCVRVAFRTRLLKGRAMGDSNIVDPYVQEAFDIEGLLLPEDEVKRKSWISFVKDSYISFRSSFKRPNAVALAYELVSSEANVDANIARVEQLLHLGLFRCSRESDPIATFLLHPAITLTLRHLFWNRQESLDPAQFSPLPKETIAFACTIVQNILHQWRDGKGELKIQLTPEVYDPIHQGYVKGIDDFIATYPKAWQHINRQLEDEVFPPGNSEMTEDMSAEYAAQLPF